MSVAGKSALENGLRREVEGHVDFVEQVARGVERGGKHGELELGTETGLGRLLEPQVRGAERRPGKRDRHSKPAGRLRPKSQTGW